jgi:phosphoribosylglycinamide formyltransferase-1
MRVAVLISGQGSNLKALLACPELTKHIALVVSNKQAAGGLAHAQRANIPTAVIAHTDYEGRAAFDDALKATLQSHQIDWVVLAGFMRILSPQFVATFSGRLLNIHPSLLPAYKGRHTHARAIADGALTHGCSVHFVSAELDGGPLIAQADCPIPPTATPESLQADIQGIEHKLYPAVLRLCLTARIHEASGKAYLDDQPITPADALTLGRSLVAD